MIVPTHAASRTDRHRTGFAAIVTVIGAVLCVRHGSPAAAAELPRLLDVPLQVSTPMAPVAFRSNGQSHLVYEIQITNLSTTPWTLRQVEVRDEHGAKLLAVDGENLTGVLWHPAGQRGSEGVSPDTVAAGESLFAYLWIDLDGKAVLPDQLSHRLLVKRVGEEQERELAAPTVQVSHTVREIFAPLRGTDWLAANGPSNTSAHRRALLVLDGGPHIGQRYAIDWVRVGPDSKTFRANKSDNRSYLCYGSEVLAAGDGVVAQIKDGIKENVPQQPPAVPISLETIAGNHINLDLGGGVFALYAHLQPRSLRVKVGDKVRRGQVLGLVGNSGNSTEPHLHFQLMNRNSPLGSEGLPYTLAEYTISKRVTGAFESEPRAVKLAAPEKHHGEMPLEMQLIDFD